MDGEGEPVGPTNAEIDRRVRAIAAALRERAAAGDRALIVCPPGLDYLASFLGCLYAGVIAVPVYPPDPVFMKRTLPRLLSVISDARPTVVLANRAVAAVADEMVRRAPDLADLTWLLVDEVEPDAADGWRRPATTGDDLAFLQYTSGSTGTPKGVMVSHANLIHNVGAINDRVFADHPGRHLVSWLPPFHDMGLIAGLLAPGLGSYPLTFMEPMAFLKRPLRWLRAVSEFKGTLTGAPNFAYDLCVAKISEEERRTLDLSGVRVAFSGAEPVRIDTIDRFARAFESSGFDRNAFYPCYGLAEGTLFVSGGRQLTGPVTRGVDAAALAEKAVVDAVPGREARTQIGCGSSIPDQEVAIVDPETRIRLPEGRIGEIWVRGPSVAHGYWQRPEESPAVFRARIRESAEPDASGGVGGAGGEPGDGAGEFLRTGDLGFLSGTELHVSGRMKDVVIIDGKNHYPQDIELTAETSHSALYPGCGVACSVEVDGEERLLVVHEVAGRPPALDTEGVIAAIRGAVAQEHGIAVHHVALLRRGGIPKTSSGKLQRGAARQAFLAGELNALASWSAPSTAADRREPPAAAVATGPVRPAPAVPAVPAAEIERRLVRELAELLGLAPESVDPTRPFVDYGMSSAQLVATIGTVEQWLERPLPATLAYEYPTIEALARHLGADAGGGRTERPVAALPEGSGAARSAAGEAAAEAVPADGRHPHEPVAIVGIGCRFPGGADDPESFWQLLVEGRDAVGEVPADRWDVAEFTSEDPSVPGRTNSRWGGFLDGVDRFDPHFFGISPHEAERMDPQQRLLAEVAWEALEDAGLVAESLAGSATGVFVGIATNDYGHRQFRDLTTVDAYSGTGNALSIAANRLSYLFDLRGPSMAVDSACSSSLVAVLQACASLARGECSLALAGGVNVILSPALAVNFTKAGVLSPDGRCKPFDASANGYVRSEGASVVVLKPLSRALADGDRVYAVIRGGAVNQDGRSNGIMAPNPQAQEEVLRAAYARAGVRPEQVHYVEAHGTGTLLGDPIEARALAAVTGAGREPGAPLLIGSVKSNIGHLEAAAGAAGLVKAALMVRHRAVPASLHYRTPNPHIPFGELSLRVADGLTPWPSQERALVGVSSFGFGGTNAHLVLEQAPERAALSPRTPAGSAQLLAVSARSEQALRELAARYEAQLAEPDEGVRLHEICTAAAVRRVHHEFRLACVGRSFAGLREALGAFGRGEERKGLSWGGRTVGRRPRTAFVFSGQGPRWWPLAGDLLDAEPVFRESLERSDAILYRLAGWSLIERLAADAEDGVLADPAVGQPALCAAQIALAALWRSWGVEPEAVVGHSVGEIAAAHVAGALDLEAALTAALHRGRVIRAAIGRGRMAVVGVGYQEARRILAERAPGAVWVAASNGPTSTVLSGDGDALEALAAGLDAEGVFCRLLESVAFASHSPRMDPLSEELKGLLGDLVAGPPALDMVSTVTGERVGDGLRLDAEYWAANLRRPVLFDQAVTGLVDAGYDVFVEISPHPMLGDAVAQRMAQREADGAVVASLRRDERGRESMLAELGRLHTAGFPVDWAAVHGGGAPMVRLPRYPWQRQRCWLDDVPARTARPSDGGHPVLGTRLPSAVAPGTVHFGARVDLAGLPYLRDHRVAGAAVLPASLILDAALTAARRTLGGGHAVVEDVRFTRLTVVPESAEDATVQLVLHEEAAGTGTLRLYTREPAARGDWTEVASGRYRDAPPPAAHSTLPALRERCAEVLDTAGHYAGLGRAGLEYGPAFQGVERLWGGAHEALARLREPAGVSGDRDPYLIHPALLDSCLQALAAALGGADAATFLPVGVGAFTLTGDGRAVRWAHATVPDAAGDGAEISGGRVELFDEAGHPVGVLDRITLRRLEPAGDQDPVAEALFDLAWQPAAAAGAAVDPGSGWWLLLADRQGVADGVRSSLEARGADCVSVTTGSGFRRVDEGGYEVDPLRRADIEALLADLAATRAAPCAGVLHAWGLDAEPFEHFEPSGSSGSSEFFEPSDSDGHGQARDPLVEPVDRICVPVLHLVQALADDGPLGAPRLLLATRGAQRVGGEQALPAVAQAALWGLARVIMLEHGELRPVVVDLDPDRPADSAAALLGEVLRPAGEAQLALRGDQRLAPRLERHSPPQQPAAIGWRRQPFDPAVHANHRILATEPGVLDSLTATPWQRTAPGPGQVEIEVAATGLNFNDVLKAMDICPGVSGVVPLGGECAGRVTAIGDGVEDVRVGQRVMAVAPSGMAAYATTEARLVAPAPERLTDVEAAATPIAFLTAVYGLEYLARLRAGETLLIHSAAGGVGLAALQVARRNGVRVLATAGSEAKRELLRSLGVEQVMDSRSLAFADEVMALTGGRGVDVVLNSLAGEALTRSVRLLAPGGRFVEIGKRDVYDDNPLPLGALKHNRAFLAVDLERSFAEQHELVAELFAEVARGFTEGDFTALPVTDFAFSQAPAAFALMAQARHTGKVVLRPDTPAAVAVPPQDGPVRAAATYLITGGLGALGLETARHLVDRGARHLVLVGRQKPSAEAESVIADLRERQVAVLVRSADVSRREDVAGVLADLDAAMPPLAGIVHAAGFLDDALLLGLDRDRMRSVAEPKAAGAWHLHRATAGRELDFFVLFSSAAALLGSPSQGNYAAANGYLDALAQYRRARGLPALSIDWGPWARIGLAAGPERAGALAAQGVLALEPRQGIEALDRLLRTGSAQACVLPLDHGRLREAAGAGLLPALLTGLLAAGPGAAAPGGPQPEIRGRLLAVEPGRRRRALLAEHCRAVVAKVLKTDAARIDPSEPLAAMGFDSLMSLELRKRLEASLHTDLPATIGWRFPTVDALVPFLAERMGIALQADQAHQAHQAERAGAEHPDGPGQDPAADDIETDIETDIDGLDDSDVEALLLARMTQIDEGRDR
ncbi:SDR family NAD(P)-dependent oxidoreductase [Kitasatospora sp. NPDC094028]